MVTTQEMAAKTTAADPLGRVLFVLAVVALALAPTQLVLTLKEIPVAPAEPVLVLAILVWAVRWLWMRDTASLPPASHWLLVLATGLGVFALRDALQFGVVKETAQLVAYLLIAVTIFRAVFTTPARVRIAASALLATTTLAVGLGVAQRISLQHGYQPDPTLRKVFADSHEWLEDAEKDTAGPAVPGYWIRRAGKELFKPASKATAYFSAETPIQVASTFGAWSNHGYLPSRTAYAGFLALVVPFMLALLVSTRRKVGMLAWGGALFVGVAISVLAGYIMPALLVGVLVTGVALGPRVARWALLGIVAYLALAAICGGINRTEILREPGQLRISQQEAHYYTGDVRHLKKFWGQQYAALNLLTQNPLLGVGAGNFQKKVSDAYMGLGSVDEQRSEPDTQSGYLLVAASSGLLGLAALLVLLGSYGRQALAWVREAPRHPWAAAALGALAALLVLSLATNPWVRGTSLVIAALLAIIGNRATLVREARIN